MGQSARLVSNPNKNWFGEMWQDLVRFGEILQGLVSYCEILWWDFVRFNQICQVSVRYIREILCDMVILFVTQWHWVELVRVKIWWDTYDEIWSDSVRCYEIWKDLVRFNEICWNLMRVWDTVRYGEIQLNLLRFSEICWDTITLSEIWYSWWDMVRFSECGEI